MNGKWSEEKARGILALYGVQTFQINALGMVFIQTGGGSVEIDGIEVDNTGAESVQFNPGQTAHGDDPPRGENTVTESGGPEL